MKRGSLSTVILVIVFLVGLAVLLYPTVSDWWNSRAQSRAIVNYESKVTDLTYDEYESEFEEAERYNGELSKLSAPLLDYGEVEGYEDILDVAGNGIMGYISIPRINIRLPIYHGTSEAVLSVAVGHLEGTSLPVGGEGTHCVLSAHRGLPSARLFTNLDKLEVGDTFTITVLDTVLTYEVDQIRIVEPNEVGELSILEGQDYVTLLTCTPYGVNTQRLLVRGHRIENAESSDVVIRNEAFELDSTMLAPLVAAPMLVVLLIVLLVKDRRPKRKRGRHVKSGRGKKGTNE